MEKGTRRHTRDHNSRLVLRTLYTGDEIGRADIARLTGLTRPTASAIVCDLLAGDLVVEAGQGPSAGGKRPTLLTVKGDGRHLIAIDLSGDEFRALALNLKGEIEADASLPSGGARGEEGFQTVCRLVEMILARTSAPLLGIGVASPGLVDPDNGIVLAGRLADLDGILLDAVVSEMHQRVLPSMAQATRVRFSSLDPQKAAVIVMPGCSALLLDRELGIV